MTHHKYFKQDLGLTALEQLQSFPSPSTHSPARQLMVTSFMKLDQVGVVDPCQLCINYSTAV